MDYTVAQVYGWMGAIRRAENRAALESIFAIRAALFGGEDVLTKLGSAAVPPGEKAP